MEYVLFKTVVYKTKFTDCSSSEQFYVLEFLIFIRKRRKKICFKKEKKPKQKTAEIDVHHLDLSDPDRKKYGMQLTSWKIVAHPNMNNDMKKESKEMEMKERT